VSLPPRLAELAEVRGALAADRRGQVVASLKEPPGAADEAAAVAVAITELSEAGATLGLEALLRIEVKGPRRTTLAAVRPDQFLFVDVDPLKRLARTVETLDAWQRGVSLPATGPVPGPSGLTGVMPAAEPPPLPTRSRAPAPGLSTLQDEDPWGSLRRTLIRGHLSRAAALQQAILGLGPSGGASPGSEPLSSAELGVAMQRLLAGIGHILAGDPVGCTRSLAPLAVEGQSNLSIRWLAHYWSARAALQSGGAEAARDHVRDTLALSRQLDVEARGISQLLAAELLSRGGDVAKALSWLAEARGRFERVSDSWGMGQTWLAEARILAGRDEAACVAAAERARDADPAWDEPLVFLAGRAVMAGDHARARAALGDLHSPAADRLRKLLEAIGEQRISSADAGDFLRVHLAPPTVQNLRAMERIANASPRFLQAREALGWLLVKLGRYAAAREIFEWLLTQPLEPGERSLVGLGLNSTTAAMAAAGAPATPAPGTDPGTPTPSDSALLPQGARTGFSGLDAMFSGRLSVFSLPDLVEFLRSAGRSGLLVCSSQGGTGALRFRQGRITGATSPASASIGALLVRTGAISTEALAAAGPAREGTLLDAGLADRLVELGAVELEAARAAGLRQIEHVLRELVDWNDGEFAFTREDEAEGAGEASIEVDAQQLLLDLFRERDESSRGPPTGTGD
jgi:predicted regulator of Ras-like GTPase activity (Roadblock/LC7/MglB family)